MFTEQQALLVPNFLFFIFPFCACCVVVNLIVLYAGLLLRLSVGLNKNDSHGLIYVKA